MSSRIQLELSGKYSATRAFKNLDEDTKRAQRNCKDFADAGKGVLSELSGVFSGQLNGAIESTIDILGEITKGGIWGIMGAVASQAIGFVVKKFTEARAAAEKLKKEYEEASKNIGSAAQVIQGQGANALTELGNAAKAAAEHVESLRKVYYAQQELAKQKAIAAGGTGEEVDNAVRIQKRADAEENAARRIEDAKKRLAAAEQNESRVLRATVNARTFKAGGADVDIGKAEKALADAQKASEDARRELANARANAEAVDAANQADRIKAENEAAEKRRQAAEKAAEERRKAEAESVAAEVKMGEDLAKSEEEFAKQIREEEVEAKKAAIEKVKREAAAQDAILQKQIAGAKAAAAVWDESAKRVRGRTFNDVERARRDATRNGPSEFERRNAANDRKAERLETDLRRGLHLSDREREWLKRYKDWKDAQDPKKNKAAQEAARLEKQREQARQKMQKTLEEIHADLTKALNVN